MNTDIEFWRLRTVEQKTGRRKSAIYADPTFPKPVKLGERASAWISNEVIAWMQARVAQRDVANKNGGAA